MYQNAYYDDDRNIVHIWDDKRGHIKEQFKPYGYIKDPSGTHSTIFGDKVKKTYNIGWNSKSPDLFESDVDPVVRTLVDQYHTETTVPDASVFIFDIETSVEGGYPDIQTADKPVISIAFTYDNVTKLLLVGTEAHPNPIVETFSTEKELLAQFADYLVESGCKVMSGWNIDYFDIPYLIKRYNLLFGSADMLSPIGIVKLKNSDGSSLGEIAGIDALDLLFLYKKLTYKEQPNYRLDTIAKIELGRGKVEYDGDLWKLYNEDIDKFIAYNLEDVYLVRDLNKKLDFINLARAICHKGNVPYRYFIHTTKYIDGAVLTFCKNKNLVVNNARRRQKTGEKYAGAYVKQPVPGRYEDVFDLDLTSLYPSVIMTLNISLETYVGMNLEGDYYKASNGACYRKDKKGIIPEILSVWFDERVELKNKMKTAMRSGNKKDAEYYNLWQMAVKILLNSVYGAVGTPSFRFYNLENSEAVTLSGQTVIKTGGKFANFWISKQTGKEDLVNPIYIDTDSLFITATSVLEARGLNHLQGTDRYSEIFKIASECQTFINKSFGQMAKKLFNSDPSEHRFDIKCEYVSSAAFWVTKKRYAQSIKLKEGIPTDTFSVTGIEVVRSDFPASFQKLLKELLIDILNGKNKLDVSDKIRNFNRGLNTQKYLDLMFAGRADIDSYEDESEKMSDIIVGSFAKGTPIRSKALMSYNQLKKILDPEGKYPSIRSKSKILWCYLKENPYFFPVIALPGENDHPDILHFVEKYIDRDMQFDSAFSKKLESYYTALSWGKPTLHEEFNDFFTFEP